MNRNLFALAVAVVVVLAPALVVRLMRTEAAQPAEKPGCALRVTDVQSEASGYSVTVEQHYSCRADGYLVTISSEDASGRTTAQQMVATGHSYRHGNQVDLIVDSPNANNRKTLRARVTPVRYDGTEDVLDVSGHRLK